MTALILTKYQNKEIRSGE